jgi:superfamily II DNA/RNA helicase
VPGDGEDYVHRIGRTARAEADGTAITLVSEEDQRKFGDIERLLEKEIEKATVPEDLGPTPGYDPKKRMGRPMRGGGSGSRPHGGGGAKKRPHTGRSQGGPRHH